MVLGYYSQNKMVGGIEEVVSYRIRFEDKLGIRSEKVFSSRNEAEMFLKNLGVTKNE